MNRKIMAVAVASALGAPVVAFGQASSVQIYGTISYGMEQRSAGGGDSNSGAGIGAGTPAAGGTMSSLRTVGGNPGATPAHNFSAASTGVAGNAVGAGTNLGGSYSALPANQPNQTATTGSGSNFGIRGRESLGGNMYAGFQIEISLQGDAVGGFTAVGNGTYPTYRNTGVWLGTSVGEFGTGMWDTPYTLSMNNTGVHNTIYGNSSTSAAAAIFGGLPFAATTYSGQPITQTCNGSMGVTYATAKSCFASVTTFSRRQANSIWYQSPDMSGFKVRAQYGGNFPNATSDPSTTSAAGTGNTNASSPNGLKSSLFSIGGTYDKGGLSLGLAWEKHYDLSAYGMRQYMASSQQSTLVLGTDSTGAVIAGFNASQMTGSSDTAWNLRGRYDFGNGFSIGAYYEKIDYSWSYGPAVATVTAGTAALATVQNYQVKDLSKRAYRLDAAYQTGPHTIGFMYNKQPDISGSTIGNGFNAQGSGVSSWQLAYGYSFSKRTSGFVYWNQVTNDTNASSSGVVFNGISAATGADPRYVGAGIRHTF